MTENSIIISKFLSFLKSSPSPYFVVKTCSEQLTDCGFKKIKNNKVWNNIHKGGKYFFIQNDSTIIAFVIGNKYTSGNSFKIIGAHTDSPCLKIKNGNNNKIKDNNNNCTQIGIEPYGGGLWNTWFDRDLGIAGKIIVYEKNFKNISNNNNINTKKSINKNLTSHLVRIDKAICRIPSLAIHLNHDNVNPFSYNKEYHLLPIIGLNNNTNKKNLTLLDMLLLLLDDDKEDIKNKEIMDYDLCLFDLQEPSIGGANDEFIFSARLDNLVSCFCAMEALTKIKNEEIENSENVHMIVFFDHEEIGSQTECGAASPLIEETMERILICLSFQINEKYLFEESKIFEKELFYITKKNSLFISADQGHAIHPNYPNKHEEDHKVYMGKGPIIKWNVQRNYATTCDTASIIRTIAKEKNIPLQDYCVRNDMSCGSTIGPIIASRMGISTIDIGSPQLSMHSIREQMCTKDLLNYIKLMYEIFMS